MALLVTPAFAQENAPESDSTADESAETTETAEAVDESPLRKTWNRLIYVPFHQLRKVLNNDDATAVVPYSEYMELLKHYWKQNAPNDSPDAVITKAVYTASVEKEVARVSVELNITVLKNKGWARLPLSFGKSAVGKMTSDDEENTLLKGADEGTYELLLQTAGKRTITLELLATVTTSPEARSFELNCPTVGINELQVTIPEGDQTVQITPVEVLLSIDGSNESQTVVKAALGATKQFTVHWFPKAGSRPQMDLLSSVSNETFVVIEPELIQTTNKFTWEILRGEMREATILVPTDARIIDVVAKSGRIQAWEATAVEGHQQVRIELLKPVNDELQIEVQTERVPKGETLQLLGRTDDNSLHGVHADSVVRESGRLTVKTDASLTLITQNQSGVKRISSSKPDSSKDLMWEFTGSRSSLTVQLKPVEPRLTAKQNSRLIFSEEELQLLTHVDFTVERAGVFELRLKYPESLTIDSVRADGMSEFNVDKAGGVITLALTNRRQDSIGVDIRGHQAFNAGADNTETILPSIEPQQVERSTGQVTVLAPRFLDVVTIEEQRTGLTPAGNQGNAQVGRVHTVSAWNFTQHPWTLAVRTSPRPAQIDATVATTVQIDPEVVRFNSEISFNIHNAGIDTFRIAAPEAIADDIRFRSLNPQHVIQQRNKATSAEDGWVTWTLVLQNEVTGSVRIGADWELTLAEADEQKTRSFEAEPVRVLAPYPEGAEQKRRVTLTQAQGELRLLRHESLSITAEATGETTEIIDVRELKRLPHEGYLAFRYFSQPAAATVSIRKHEIHEVVATVVSKAAIEIVTEKQPLASYRCRYRITTSERQRLRIDVPVGSELQAPSLNKTRTTFEPAEDVESEAGWEASYINISRKGNSDESFLLSFQLRCPISEAERFPYEGKGGEQLLRTPRIGDASGSTVVQETRVGLWTPKDVVVIGEPQNWSPVGRQSWSILRPLQSSNNRQAAASLASWINDNSSTSDFSHQGNATVYRALGNETVLQASWWNYPFMMAIVSGALIIMGLVLKRTSWENRITLILVGLVAFAIWKMFDENAAVQVFSAGALGLLAVAGIWIMGLLIGRRPHKQTTSPPPSTDNDGDGVDNKTPPPASPPDVESPKAPSAETPPGTITPAPGVKDTMDNLMGGK